MDTSDHTNGQRTPIPGDPGDRSTVQLVRDIAGDTATLVRKEVQLARQEVMEGIAARIKAVAAYAVGGVLALVALVFLGLSAATALDRVVEQWASRLIMGGGFLVISAAAVLFARRRMKAPSLKPEEAVRTVKEDVGWAKAQLKR